VSWDRDPPIGNRSQGAYSENDWRLVAQPFEKRASDHRLYTGASLIVTVLLSLGIWATIWEAVASLFSVAL
jgi:hypothetical protein